MKKLMIALVIVACAAVSQASVYNWKMSKGQVYQAGSTTAKLASGKTAYLINADYSQTDLIKALFVDKTLTIANIGTKAIAGANSSVNGTSLIAQSSNFTYNDVEAGNTWNAYYVIVDGENVFVSANTTQAISASALETPVPITAFTSPTTDSQAAAKNGALGYAGQGWYTSAVPEPTSGLLLLLGVAGLALKRRRA